MPRVHHLVVTNFWTISLSSNWNLFGCLANTRMLCVKLARLLLRIKRLWTQQFAPYTTENTANFVIGFFFPSDTDNNEVPGLAKYFVYIYQDQSIFESGFFRCQIEYTHWIYFIDQNWFHEKNVISWILVRIFCFLKKRISFLSGSNRKKHLDGR